MPRNAVETRTQILDAAERLFLTYGYAGTSIDTILRESGLTKGAFFHHFASKHDLAHALIDRYAALDRARFDENVARAERLSRDPLQQVLIVIGLYEEAMDQLVEPFPGCLFASYCYQAGLFDTEVLAVVREELLGWREVMGGKLQQALEHYSPRMAVDASELADMGLAVLEGAFILSKTLKDPKLVAGQLRHYRNYLELLFGLS